MDNSLAYSEVYEILSLLEENYLEKIPKKIIDFFEEERNIEYRPEIDSNVPLNEQNIKRETMALLAMLYVNYWCDSDEEKQELLTLFSENDEMKSVELEEKYNIDSLFNKNEQYEINEEQSELAIIEVKETNFIQKILLKIKSLFKRRN